MDRVTLFRMAADLAVLLHAGFVVFVVLGALLVARWPKLVWVHLPAAAWGAFVELRGWICPLTPLENWLRRRAGTSTYQGDFIEHYVLPVLYPAQLTRGMQLWLGGFAVGLNLIAYWWLIRRRARSTSRPSGMRDARP